MGRSTRRPLFAALSRASIGALALGSFLCDCHGACCCSVEIGRVDGFDLKSDFRFSKMGLFGKKEESGDHKRSAPRDIQITEEDERRMKARSQNLHDPILNAVTEAQPFEEANVHQRNSSIGNGILSDIFGNQIVNPDVSNPTRSRDERPLDTIRGFEYSITGDPIYHEQLESHIIGWKVRDDYPLADGYVAGANQVQYDEYGQPIYTNQQQTNYVEQGVYTAPAAKAEEPKKKKFFSFGKK